MKLCEYTNNIISLSVFLFLVNKISVGTNFSLEIIYEVPNIIIYDTKKYIKDFNFNVEQKGEIGNINLIKTSYNYSQLKFIDEYIRKHGKVPMTLDFYYGEGNKIILEESIRGGNPIAGYLRLGDRNETV